MSRGEQILLSLLFIMFGSVILMADNYASSYQANSTGTKEEKEGYRETKQDVYELALVTRKDSITNKLGMKLNYVEPGEFWMGSPDSERFRMEQEGPRHRVKLSRGFYMGVTEVTQGQWKCLMGSVPPIVRGGIKTGTMIEDPNRPVECVSWIDANDFCRKLSVQEKRLYRLPTEAEWEYACRAGSETAYCFGEDPKDLIHYAQVFPSGSAQPVAQKKANAWGFFDMHGNVWEWCRDAYESDYYSSLRAYAVDPEGPAPKDKSTITRTLRGGGWCSQLGCRSAFRGGLSQKYKSLEIGFRVVLEPGSQTCND